MGLGTETRETVLAHLPEDKLLPLRIKVKDNDFQYVYQLVSGQIVKIFIQVVLGVTIFK